MSTLVLILLALPLVAAVLAALVGSKRALYALAGPHEHLAELLGPDLHSEFETRAEARQASLVRCMSLTATIICLVLAVVVAWNYTAPRIRSEGNVSLGDHPTFAPGLETRTLLISLGKDAAVYFHVGLDGLNVWLIVLTALLMVSSVLISWTAIKERVPEFYAWLLMLEFAMIGVFLAFDVILFYVFFELSLVPLFFLIGIWGGPERQYAARKFFIFTLAGSLITLLGVLGVSLTLHRDGSTERDYELSLQAPEATANRKKELDEAARLTFSMPELVRKVAWLSADLGKQEKIARDSLAQAEDEARKAPEATRAASEARVKRAGDELDRVLKRSAWWRGLQNWLFAAMMVGFAIKVPLVPVHTWLPLAHTEAPTAGSVLLAGVLLKIGVYGFMRLCLPLTPDAALALGAPLIGWLATIGIIYGSFCALAQEDFKKLVAYSSVAHLGYCMLGLFALNEPGFAGSLLQMINHGLSTGALFLLVGMLYERYHTRRMEDYGGMAARLKLLAASMVFITMSSVALPGLNGFIGEALVLLGMYNFQGSQVPGRLLASLSAFGALLGAWYMMTLLRRVFFGPVKEPHVEGHGPASDMNGREIVSLAPIALLCLVLGLYPKPFLDAAKPELATLAKIAQGARERAAPPPARAE
jgi:NADH-quinone oxidoreductase subunit M